MNLVPIFVLVASPEAVTITNRIENAHAKLTSVSVLVSDGLTNVIPTKIKIAPGICSLEMPNQQIVEVKANEIRFYDEIFNQVATLKNPKEVKVPDAAAKVAIVQRDPIAWLLDSAQKKGFFADMKKDKRWQVNGNMLLLPDAKRKSMSEIHFDNTYRVTEIKLRMNNKTVYDWKYQFVGDGAVPKIPATAKSVRGLDPRPAMPAKTDGRTVMFAQKIWRSISRLEGRKITQETDDATYSLTYGKGKIAESGPKGSWSLLNTTMTVSPKNGQTKSYSGATDRFLDILRTRGVDSSPMARYLLNRKIPFLDMFERAEEVKLVDGAGNIGGKKLSVISVRRAGIRIRLYADPTSGDLAMVSSDSQDAVGNIVSGTRLKIKYR